ncbi:MAG: hypothetical protein HGB11_14020, partial [Chlorobiales bacterium]|nr:hypothetical protein [Chlorobiales bacterium]
MKKNYFFKCLILFAFVSCCSFPLYGQSKGGKGKQPDVQATATPVPSSQIYQGQTAKPSPISQAVIQEIFQNKSKLSGADQKLSSHLLALKRQMQLDGVSNANAKSQGVSSAYSNAMSGKVDDNARIYVYLKAAKGYSTQDVRNALQTIGGTADVWNDQIGLVQAWVYYGDLTRLAEAPAIRGIDPVIAPFVN